jgi:hypothetical protein
MVATNLIDAIKIITTIFGKIAILFRGTSLKGPPFMEPEYSYSPDTDVWRMSRESAAGIAAGYGFEGRGVGVRVPVGARLFSSPRRPDRLWGPSSLLSKG